MWVQDVTEFLVEQKRDGVPFGQAWDAAVFTFPPNMRELGYRHAGTLMADRAEQEGLAWFRAICENAYVDAPAADGSRSRLRGLRAALEDAGPSMERLGPHRFSAGHGAVAA